MWPNTTTQGTAPAPSYLVTLDEANSMQNMQFYPQQQQQQKWYINIRF